MENSLLSGADFPWIRASSFKKVYSPHKVQITNFWEFLYEYCEEKSETFTEF